MAEVVCLGEALIDFVALESGVWVGQASGFLRAPGGAPANVAAGVARLGGSSAFLGKVGDDPFGRFLEQTLAAAGVDTGGMVFDSAYRTGLAFVSLTEAGERDFCFFRNPSADRRYSLPELDTTRIENGRIFHFGSITLIDAVPRKTTLAAIQIARASGLLVSYDPNLRPALWPDLRTARRVILRAVRYADIVKLSEEELRFLLDAGNTFPVSSSDSDTLTEDAALFLRTARNVRLLAVTRGAAGCYWRRGEQEGFVPGFRVTAVDTTGAGDGFVAGMLTGLREAGIDRQDKMSMASVETLEALFRRANAVGALTTTQKGAIPALPAPSEVAALLARGFNRVLKTHGTQNKRPSDAALLR